MKYFSLITNICSNAGEVVEASIKVSTMIQY
jgi:hypothetical protein